MILEITHATRLHYPVPVVRSTNLVHLLPADGEGQRRLAFALTLQPPSRVRAYADPWGNTVQYFTIRDTHFEFTITARSRVETSPPPAPSGQIPWATYRPQALGPMLDLTLQTPLTDPGRFASPAADGGDAWAWITGVVTGLTAQLRYRKGTTGVETRATEVLTMGEGVCQDFAHAALGLLRARGIPARYVGGYQYLGPDAHHDPHAWIEVWHPSGTWVGFDPTTGALVDERYVRVAVGRDYTEAAPVRGHVAFASPPADLTPAPPEVNVTILAIPSRDTPLGFMPDPSEAWDQQDSPGRQMPESVARRTGKP